MVDPVRIGYEVSTNTLKRTFAVARLEFTEKFAAKVLQKSASCPVGTHSCHAESGAVFSDTTLAPGIPSP